MEVSYERWMVDDRQDSYTTGQLAAHSGVKAYGGSKQSPGTDTVVKDGDSFKIGKGVDVKCVKLSSSCPAIITRGAGADLSLL